MKNIKLNTPPKFGRKLIRLFTDFEYSYSLDADLNEVYGHLAEKESKKKADLWYWKQVAKTFIPYLRYGTRRSFNMYRNYLKIAFRNLKKYKSFSFINISSLIIGITSCTLIMLWVQDEMSFDTFNENYDNLYRIVQTQQSGDLGDFHVAPTSGPMGRLAREEIPEVTNSARMRPVFRKILVTYGDKKIYESNIAYAEQSIFELFSFNIVKGDKVSALADKNSIAISEKLAEKYFGDDDPIGQVFQLNTGSDYKIAAVFENIPTNSHLQFDMLLSYTIVEQQWGWFNNIVYAYVQTIEGADPDVVSQKIQDIYLKVDPDTDTKFYLQPLKDIYLNSDFAIDLYGASEVRSTYVYIFSIVAFFTLLIACLNFVNLSTARSNIRAKEVGMRKVTGAGRTDIIKQFLGESTLLTMIAVGASVGVTLLVLPTFSEIASKNFTPEILLTADYMLMLLGVTLVTAFVSGMYPAFYFSAFNPVRVLKGISSVKNKKSGFRKVMVISQFAISIIIISGALVITDQLEFIKNKNLGLSKDQFIYLEMTNSLRTNFDSFKNELLSQNGISKVTVSSDLPTYTIHSTGCRWEGQGEDERMMIHHYSVGYDFMDAFGVELLEGRGFSKTMDDDSSKSYILNETALAGTGMKNPIGKRFNVWGREGKIVGIMKDFHFKSLHKKVEPMAIRIRTQMDRYVFIKSDSDDIAQTLATVGKVFESFETKFPFDYKFLDTEFAGLYENEERVGSIFRIFSFLAIVISCLGLIGLASFFTEQRTKELGVRKVLGASIPNLLKMLTGEFVVLIIAANVIAVPAAWILMDYWLQNFAYHIDVSGMTFVISAGLSVLAAVATISYKSYKAASANPINSLRYE